MNVIPKKIREQADKLYEAPDNSNCVISAASGRYVPKNGTIFSVRHYHHLDHDRSHNEIWNLAPLTYEEHILKEHSASAVALQQQHISIYEYMSNIFPEHEPFYKKVLLE